MKNKCTKSIFRINVFLVFLALIMSPYALSDVEATPLNIRKNVKGVFSGQTKIVEANETITYRIHFNNNDNDFRATEVTIVDILPKEVSFVMADYDLSLGFYDEGTHTYTWFYAPLEPDDATAVELTVQVKPDVAPGTTITNTVVIDSEQTPEASSSVDVMTSGVVNRFNLSKSIVGAVEDVHKVGLGEHVIYSIRFDGNAITQPVTNVSVTDVLPREVSLIKADGDGVIGHYDENTHTYTWLYPFILPGQVVRLELTVKVNEDVAPGETITNLVTINAAETPPATASVDMITDAPRTRVETLEIIPNIIRRDDALADIMAVLVFPDGIGVEQIGNEPLVLVPGKIEARQQIAIEEDGKTTLTARFDKTALLNAVPGFFGALSVEVTGKFISGRPFYGQTIVNIIETGEISEYISDIDIQQIWDYGYRTDSNNLMYEFSLGIYADGDKAINTNANVASIDFLTPAGNTFQIPKLPGQSSKGIWTAYEYDSDWGQLRWEYRARSANLDDLKTYGDGEYTITVHYLNGGQDQITVWFGTPGTQDPIPQPTQEPVLTSPLHHQTVQSPVGFTWEPCTDKNTTEIWIDVEENSTGGDKGDSFNVNRTSWGPVDLTDGSWKAVLAFGQWFSSNDINGIWIEVGKYSRSQSEFIVVGYPANTYEVWGGETFIGLDSGTYVGGGYGSIALVEASGYIKLGESQSRTATFSGRHKYYLIATTGQFLLDSIQGPNETYYSTFVENFDLYNVIQPDNLLGKPDGKCARIGQVNPMYDFSGYFVFTNPGDWTELTVITRNLNLSKSIVGSSEEIETVSPNDTITYKICVDSNDLVDNVTNITIKDILPYDVSFVSAQSDDASGEYDPETHTYTWSYPLLRPKSAIEMQITVKVNPDVGPGTMITNFVIIDSDQIPASTSSVNAIVPALENHLNLSKTVVGAMGEIEKVALNQEVTYCICIDGNDINYPIQNVSVIDILPKQVSFIRADGDGDFGHYDENTHTYTWSFPSISPGQVVRLKLTVKINEDVTLGETITNLVSIDAEEIPSQTESVDIRTHDWLVDDPQITPSTIRRNGAQVHFKAVLPLPPDQILDSNAPVILSILSPGNFETKIVAKSKISNDVMLTAWFGVNDLMRAVPDYYGILTVAVQGSLTSGQTFYGKTDIRISRFAGN